MKKIKNKKTLIMICSLLFVVVVGVTYALFYSNTSLPNIFGLGNYNVVTSETFTSPASWQPGQEIPKSITATNNGDIQAAFRVKYTESWVDSNNNPISNVPANAVTINFINTRDWTYNSTDGYYYYNWIIEPGDTTSSLISGITLNQDLTGSANCVEDGNTYNCSSSLSGLSGATYTLTFTKETVIYSKYQQYWQTNQSIVEPPLYTLPYGRTESNLQLGDEICVNGDTTECFNFIRYDGDNVVMLSKWNLNVGSNAKGTATNLQDSDVKGYVSSGTKYGNVTFSGTNYWYDGSALKSKYGSSYPADVYDTDYIDASGNNYSVAYYVENYKNVLETYGLNVQSARLLTYSEATTNVGCSGGSSCPTNGFITNTSFWLGSADGNYGVWSVISFGVFRGGSFRSDLGFGVRPVIEVAKSGVSGNYDNADRQGVPITIPSGRTRDNLQLGDEVCVEGSTTECFNFIRYDGDNVVMLSKWNLNVGSNAKGTATNLQDSDVKGYVSSGTKYGNVTFSGTNYWYDGSALKSKYGSSYPADVYDTDYIDASGNNYSVAYYVENYKNVLETYGLNVQSARLLTYSEATTNVGCSGSSCPTNGFITNTSFWLGSADYDNYVWIVTSRGTFRNYDFDDGNYFGVRPVIVISKSDI